MWDYNDLLVDLMSDYRNTFYCVVKYGGVLLCGSIKGPVLLVKLTPQMRDTSLRRNCRQISPVRRFLINKPISWLR